MYFGLTSAARRLLSKEDGNDTPERFLEECDLSLPSSDTMNVEVVAEESFMDCRDLGGSSPIGRRTPLIDDLGYFDDEFSSINGNSFAAPPTDNMRIQSNHNRNDFRVGDYTDLPNEGFIPGVQTRDISANEAIETGDLQGIPWTSLDVTRETYRQTRLQRYKHYSNLKEAREIVEKTHSTVHAIDNYFDFFRCVRRIVPSILHFQLRHLLKATNANDVVLMNNNCIKQWNSVANEVSTLVDLSGHQSLDAVQISTIHHDFGLLFVGGFHGELICQRLADRQLLYRAKLVEAENSISNSIGSFMSKTGACSLVCANNDSFVDVLDIESFKKAEHYKFNWPVNHCSTTQDGRLFCMVGDNQDAMIMDHSSGDSVATLSGHFDYSFASAWHPNGHLVATGNQDRTTRVWDIRKPSQALKVLPARMAAVRSLKFSEKGDFLIVGEAADFCHIYDCHSDFTTYQDINFFGEVAGVDISPDDSKLFIGVTDNVYGSILEFQKRPVRWIEQSLF